MVMLNGQRHVTRERLCLASLLLKDNFHLDVFMREFCVVFVVVVVVVVVVVEQNADSFFFFFFLFLLGW